VRNLSFRGRNLSSILTDLYLALMVSVFLLFPGFGGYQTITEDKFRLLCWLTGGYLLLMLLLPLEVWIVGGQRPRLPVCLRSSAWPRLLILLYLVWAILSTVFSVAPAQSLWGGPRREGLLSVLLYGGAFLLASLFGKAKRWLLWLFAASVSLCCVVALLQLAGQNPFGLYPEGMNYYDGFVLYAGRFLGTIGNVDLLCAVLCIAIPAFWTAILRLSGRSRLFLLVPLALSLAALLGSKVEAGIVGIFGGALLTVPVVWPEGRQRKVLGVLSGILILLGLAGIYFFGDHLPGFLREAYGLLHGQVEDSFGSGRIYIWRNVLPLIPERPLLGGGPETLSLRSEILFERYHEQLGLLLQSYADTAHNEYLNVMVELGIPAFVFYFGALLLAARFWVKTAPESPAAAICGAGVMGYCVQAFFSMSSVVSAPFFWLALALLLSEAVEKHSDVISKPINRRKHK